MTQTCNHRDHSFPIHSAGLVLAPGLDLVPGRRCHCGTHVIIDHPAGDYPQTMYLLACIDSPAAAEFARHNPALKTW